MNLHVFQCGGCDEYYSTKGPKQDGDLCEICAVPCQRCGAPKLSGKHTHEEGN